MIRLVKKCIGVLGGIPLGEWGVPKSQIEGRGKAFPLMIIGLLMFVKPLLADVTCIWNGNSYDCSGTGERVVVQGGGDGVLAPVVTNIVGVCTNCSAISPDNLRTIGDQIAIKASELETAANQINDLSVEISNMCRSNLVEISTYQSWSGYSERNAATNYMYTVSNSQTEGMRYVYENQTSGMVSGTRLNAAMSAGNGIYYYANNIISPQLMQARGKANTIEQRTMEINDTIVPTLRSLSDQILEGAQACVASTNNATGGQGGGALTGDWCTYEQGESIISLLQELSTLLQSWEDYLENIETYIRQTRDVISKGVFSEYTNIPENTDWKTVYISGQSTGWGYEPTNTLQRIELMLYGLTGVGTNETQLASDEAISPDSLYEHAQEELNATTNAISSIQSDASGAPAQSLGQAVVGFFNAFARDGESLTAGSEVMPSVNIQMGTEYIEVPALRVGEAGVDVHNTMQRLFAGVFTAFYALATAWCIFLYWRWFAGVAAQMSKWAIELVTSIFTS